MTGMTSTGGPIRLVVVDDDALVRAGLSMMLAETDDLQIVADAADGDQAIQAVEAHGPDVVLMDIRMPNTDGLAATEALRARAQPPEVIVLTTFDTDEHVLAALRAGAGGFLLKDTPPDQLVRAVRQVAAGEPMLSPSVTRQLIAHATAGHDPPQTGARHTLAGLSDREREIAIALGRGRSNAEIAAELYMSVATVKAHVSRLLTKLDLNNRVQIALLAHDAGLV